MDSCTSEDTNPSLPIESAMARYGIIQIAGCIPSEARIILLADPDHQSTSNIKAGFVNSLEGIEEYIVYGEFGEKAIDDIHAPSYSTWEDMPTRALALLLTDRISHISKGLAVNTALQKIFDMTIEVISLKERQYQRDKIPLTKEEYEELIEKVFAKLHFFSYFAASQNSTTVAIPDKSDNPRDNTGYIAATASKLIYKLIESTYLGIDVPVDKRKSLFITYVVKLQSLFQNKSSRSIRIQRNKLKKKIERYRKAFNILNGEISDKYVDDERNSIIVSKIKESIGFNKKTIIIAGSAHFENSSVIKYLEKENIAFTLLKIIPPEDTNDAAIKIPYLFQAFLFPKDSRDGYKQTWLKKHIHNKRTSS